MKTIEAIKAPTVLWNSHQDLPEDNRRETIDLLNQQLADAIDLSLQAKQAHWNVKGPHFQSLHALFDEVAEQLGELTDEVAERAVSLGGLARGTSQAVQARSRLPAYPVEAQGGNDHLWAMANAVSRFAKSTRAAIGQAEELEDAVTVDLFTQITSTTDKLLWKLEAHLVVD